MNFGPAEKLFGSLLIFLFAVAFINRGSFSASSNPQGAGVAVGFGH